MKTLVIVIFSLLSIIPQSIVFADLIPIGGGVSTVYNGIPFFFVSDMYVNHTPPNPDDPGTQFYNRDTPQLFYSTRVHFLSSLAWSHYVIQDTVVGEFRGYYTDGSFDYVQLIAGINTAEWAWDRPENASYILHNRAEVGFSYLTNQGSNYWYEAHRYYGYLDTNPSKELESFQLIMADSFYNSPSNWLGIGIPAITIEGEPIPEPSTILLLTIGLGSMTAIGIRKKCKL